MNREALFQEVCSPGCCVCIFKAFDFTLFYLWYLSPSEMGTSIMNYFKSFCSSLLAIEFISAS